MLHVYVYNILRRLNKVVMEVATERAQRFKGRTLEVLVEGPNPKNKNQVGEEGRGGKEHAHSPCARPHARRAKLPDVR